MLKKLVLALALSSVSTLAFAQAPKEGGVVNAASFGTTVAPGSLISIFGRNLGVLEAGAARLPLPTELGGLSVTLNGRALPLLYSGAGQINAQLPFDMSGTLTLRVSTPNGAAQTTLRVSDAAPGIFVAATEAGRVATVLRADGTLASAASPVRPGENLTVFLTGLGAVAGDVQAGQAAPTVPLATTRLPVAVRISSTMVTPSYSGLAPGYAGLYQVNFRVPPDMPPGLHSLEILADGVPSNIVTLSVH